MVVLGKLNTQNMNLSLCLVDAIVYNCLYNRACTDLYDLKSNALAIHGPGDEANTLSICE